MNFNALSNITEDDDFDPEVIIIEGFRQSRVSTNWLHRGTAVTTTDRMDTEQLRCHAVDMEEVVAFLFPGLPPPMTTAWAWVFMGQTPA